MKKIIVLGCGMVGKAMAIDLSKKHDVTVTDINIEPLNLLKSQHPKIKTVVLDVTKKNELKATISPFDVVLSAVPGFMGFKTLEQIITCKKDVIDISFFPENALELNALAIKNNVTAIVDCGVAPGMDNIILGYHNEKMKITDFECLVGGLPKIKKWPFSYKAPFSPIDVIEEYTRPARYVENGQIVVKPALSDTEYVQFKEVGTLESFNSDGLRSIIFTMPHIPNMKEKTLRYPGHIEYVKVLKESGFFDTTPVLVNGIEVSPLEFSSKILFKEWKLGATEPEFTIMSVSLTGTENGVDKKITYYLYDEYDEKTQTSSMSRTTGYTATAAVNLFLDGIFTEKGIFPPELIGKHELCFHYFMNYLKERGVIYRKEEIVMNAEASVV